MGFLLGYVFRVAKKLINNKVAYFATGFLAALLNFIFFMGLLALCFGNSTLFADFLHNSLGKASMAVYIAGTFVTNTIFEIIITTVLTGLIGVGLSRARLLDNEK